MSKPPLLKKLASPVLYSVGHYQRRWRRRAKRRPFATALVYHRVVPDDEDMAGRFDIERGISAGVFEAQIRFMLKHFKPVRPSAILEPSDERPRFTVTLDDGYEDNYRVAAPILRRLGVPAVFYVVSEYVGTARLFWWEQLADMIRASKAPSIDPTEIFAKRDSEPMAALALQSSVDRILAFNKLTARLQASPHHELPLCIKRISDALEVKHRDEGRDYALMDWSQLKDLVNQGFEIGGHTATHNNVVGLDEETLTREIVGAIQMTEQRLDVPVQTFAYPYGRFTAGRDNMAAIALRQTSCKLAFTGVDGVVEPGMDAFELPRIRLNRRYAFACAYNLNDALWR